MADQSPSVIRWLLDVNAVWPGDKIQAAVEKSAIPDALNLISNKEREAIFRKYFVQDARISLGSALLKRLFLCKVLNEPWDTDGNRFGRRKDPVHGKPCVLDSSGRPLPNVDFNISHQAGIVVLVACVSETKPVEVGVDVVCVNERNDYDRIDSTGGFDKWVESFDQFFHPAELQVMRYDADVVRLLDGKEVIGSEINTQDIKWQKRGSSKQIRYKKDGKEGSFDADLLIEAKLRRFFAYYAYHEAFVKLTGDALLASWLQDLEVRNVRSPAPGSPPRRSTSGSWGETIGDEKLEVWLKGSKVENLKMEIQGYREQFMFATAVRTDGAESVVLKGWEEIVLSHEVEKYTI